MLLLPWSSALECSDTMPIWNGSFKMERLVRSRAARKANAACESACSGLLALLAEHVTVRSGAGDPIPQRRQCAAAIPMTVVSPVDAALLGAVDAALSMPNLELISTAKPLAV